MISVLAVACVAGLCPGWVHAGTAASAALRHVPPARWSSPTLSVDPEKPAASGGRRGPVDSTGDPGLHPSSQSSEAARRSAEDVWDARWPESTGTVLNTTRRRPRGQCCWPGARRLRRRGLAPARQGPGSGPRCPDERPGEAQQGGPRRSRPAVSDGRDQISVSGSPDRSRCPRAGWPRRSPCRAPGSRSRRTRSSGTARPSPLRSARR